MSEKAIPANRHTIPSLPGIDHPFPMKTNKAIMLLLALSGANLCLANEWFLRPTYYVLSPTGSGHDLQPTTPKNGYILTSADYTSGILAFGDINGTLVAVQSGDYANRAAVGFAAGAIFGSGKHHELSVEVFTADWEAGFDDGWYAFEKRDRITPVLCNYRYHFDTPIASLRAYAGPSLGGAYTSQRLYEREFAYQLQSRSRDVVPAYSGSLGLLYTVYRHVDLDLGYRYLYIDHSQQRNPYSSYTKPALHANMVYASANLRF